MLSSFCLSKCHNCLAFPLSFFFFFTVSLNVVDCLTLEKPLLFHLYSFSLCMNTSSMLQAWRWDSETYIFTSDLVPNSRFVCTIASKTLPLGYLVTRPNSQSVLPLLLLKPHETCSSNGLPYLSKQNSIVPSAQDQKC